MGYIGVTVRELIYRSDDFTAWEILVIFRYSEELGGLIGLYVKMFRRFWWCGSAMF